MAIENIQVQETLTVFGYDISELRTHSEKLVIWKCANCCLVKNKKYRQAIKNSLCLKCSNGINSRIELPIRIRKLIEWHKFNDHPLLNTKRPPHVVKELNKGRKKAHEKLKTEEYRKKLSLSQSGEKNHFFGKKHTEEALNRMRIFQKTNPAIRGKRSNFYGQKPKHGRGAWYSCKDGSKIWMRSSWEIKFASYLDNKNIDWLYEIKKFPIIYESKEGTYTPDFFLKKENKFIEIKGWWRDDAYKKYIAFREQYPNLCVELIDKVELKKLGIKL